MFASLVVLRSTVDTVNVSDALLILPPISPIPLAVRAAMGDDGDPRGRARTAAYYLHRACGWVLTALGVLFVVSLFFIYVAPLPLIAGALHLYAASRYGAARSDDAPGD